MSLPLTLNSHDNWIDTWQLNPNLTSLGINLAVEMRGFLKKYFWYNEKALITVEQ